MPGGQRTHIHSSSAGTLKCTLHYPSQLNIPVVTHKNLGVGKTSEVEFVLALQGMLTAEQDKAGGGHVGILIPLAAGVASRPGPRRPRPQPAYACSPATITAGTWLSFSARVSIDCASLRVSALVKSS